MFVSSDWSEAEQRSITQAAEGERELGGRRTRERHHLCTIGELRRLEAVEGANGVPVASVAK
jgi:hypothetical protein